MDRLFKTSSTFASLSLRDLIDARELFHYHLLNKKNVVATALALYRIRKGDPWPSKDDPDPTHRRKPTSERRTLFNSEVRPYSWPCIYVFVSSWEYETSLSKGDPSDVVPPTLLLPDGRAVPVCVIEARRQPWSRDLRIDPRRLTPRNLLGPGVALINNNSQGMTRLATAGAIVRDGERFYVLTNKHAVGAAGTAINALQIHRQPVIGVAADKGLTRADFAAVYPNLHASKQRLLMDVGLVDVDDILHWKTEVPGIAPIGPVLDLYDNNLTLKLITQKVVGYAAVSGLIRGEIHGLFYRYKALGGFDYVSDFLIGPETYGSDAATLAACARQEQHHRAANVALGVHHGDSGTLLFIEHVARSPDGDPQHLEPHYLPFALLWGKETFGSADDLHAHPYALATSLSAALDLLNLDLVSDINSDQTFVWGWVGHYAIGRALPLPADVVTSAKLQAFIQNNLDRLSVVPDAALDNDPRVLNGPDGKPGFVPLADVPDNVWKSNVNFAMVEVDGRKQRRPGPGSRGQDDNPNHFADLDLPYRDGETFLQLNQEDPDTYLNPGAWIAYFAAMQPRFAAWAALLGRTDTSKHWGALPFRVHQLFDSMVAAATQRDAALFLCAGGVLIHYVGDACQPLHSSYLSQGDPARVVDTRTGRKKLEADRVHSGYEDDMIAYGYQHRDLATALQTRIAQLTDEPIGDIVSGYGASKAIIALIAATHQELPPREIVERWVALIGHPDKAAAMWDAFGARTVTCMARGTRYLAKLWQAAWDLGQGDARIDADATVTEGALMRLYDNPAVLPSVALDRYPADRDADWSHITRRGHA